MAFNVKKSVMLALIQDLGRFGYQAAGLTTGGPMDEMAFRWGNALLNNDENASQIEITFGLFSLEAQAPTSIALTGADLGATLNGQSILPWQTYAIKQGDVLSFHQPVWGLRAYLSVKGGFLCQPTLGSTSTVVREHLGGLHGNGAKLEVGDSIAYESSNEHRQMRVPRHHIPDYSQQNIPVILSYQSADFSTADHETFFSSRYRVSSHCDRMGYRMEGTPIGKEIRGITSEGIAYGAIQIPQDGQPIVLLNDRQTIGGYPKIGCVTRAGGDLLAQRKPGDLVRFASTSIQKATTDRFQQLDHIKRLFSPCH